MQPWCEHRTLTKKKCNLTFSKLYSKHIPYNLCGMFQIFTSQIIALWKEPNQNLSCLLSLSFHATLRRVTQNLTSMPFALQSSKFEKHNDN